MSGLCSSRTICGTQWCASYHPVCLSERYGTCDALLCMSHTLQSAFESGQEARNVQVDFSACDRGIIYIMHSKGILGSALFILTHFLSNLSQHVMMDGFRSKLVSVV